MPKEKGKPGLDAGKCSRISPSDLNKSRLVAKFGNILFTMNKMLSPLLKSKETIKESPAKVTPGIDTSLLAAIDPQTLTDSYVYVHCYFENEWKDALVRIWKTTFLIDRAGGAKSALIHAENISIAPLWTLIPDHRTHTFLLIFGALPKSCTQFDLVEEISLPGGFHVTNISRNQQDVYHIEV